MRHASRWLAALAATLAALVVASGLSSGASPSPSPAAPSDDVGCASARSTCGGPAGTAVVPSGDFDLGQVFSWSAATGLPVATGSGAGLASDPQDALAVLFGGDVNGTLSDSLLQYNETAPQSVTNLTGAPGPSARAYFGFASDPVAQTAVLFGGLVNASTDRVDNATWVYHFATGNWSNVSNAHAPPAREGAAFAVDPTGGYALLFGGWNQNDSGIGALTYSDLWKLNLTTDAWSPVVPAGSVTPPPLQGASLTWDPELGVFQLFGGCYPCSNAVWDFDPSNSTWTETPAPSGAVPSGRAYAAWSWDPFLGSDVLFGGTDGTGIDGDTFLYLPSSNAWAAEAVGGAPSARSAPAATWLNATGNQTLLLAGGASPAGFAPELWRLAPTANLTVEAVNTSSAEPIPFASVRFDGGSPVETDADGELNLTQVGAQEHLVNVSALGYAAEQRSFWVPPAAPYLAVFNLTPVAPASISVRVVGPTGVGVEGALVNLSVAGVVAPGSPSLSGPLGFANFTALASEIPVPDATVTAWTAFNYTASSTIALAPGANDSMVLTVVPFPMLNVQVLGDLANGTQVPVAGALVHVYADLLGRTGPTGWINRTTPIPGTVMISASAFGFMSASPTFVLPHTGVFYAAINLSGVPFGTIQASVRTANGSVPIANATVFAVPVPGATDNLTSSGRTDSNGLLYLPVPVGQYNVTASAYGYYPASTPEPIVITSRVVVPVLLFLFLLPGAAVNVLVHAEPTGAPLAAAHVGMAAAGQRTTNPAGWANYTNVHFGITLVNVTATGYEPNATILDLTPFEDIPELLINLTPLRTNLTNGTGVGGTGPFSGFTTAVQQVAPFLVVVVVVLLGVAIYLVYLRLAADRRPELPPSSAPATPLGDRRPPG